MKTFYEFTKGIYYFGAGLIVYGTAFIANLFFGFPLPTIGDYTIGCCIFGVLFVAFFCCRNRTLKNRVIVEYENYQALKDVRGYVVYSGDMDEHF